MLNKYIERAMRQAKYEILADDNSFYGEISNFQGVYANAVTLEDCRNELAEVLEEWIFFRLSKNLPMPVVDGLRLSIQKVA
ncbi:MAG: type II toxin-antitoxin system HicB family antitoxin [Pyrinomonadaceae bacterium]